MDAERGAMGRLPFAAVGTGVPVVVLAALLPTTGVDGQGVLCATLGPVAELRILGGLSCSTADRVGRVG